MFKKYLIAIISVICMVSMLVGCGAPKGVDVSKDLMFTVEGDFAVLSSYPGSEENIIIPEKLGGKPVTMIMPSFAEGKTFKSVVLPSQISNYAITDSGYALCANGQGEKQIPINQFTAAGVYCSFFNTNSIWVNGKKYKYDAEKALTAKQLDGIWQTTCEVNGENTVVYLEFLGDGKQLRISREGKTIKYLFDYTVKDGKIDFEVYEMGSASFGTSPNIPKGDIYQIERIGDALIIWEENIIFYPMKDLEKLKPESTDVWVYEKCDGGIMITGYKGSAAIPSFPTEIDGQEVRWIKSTVADDYNFTNISINTFDFFKVGDDGYYYFNTFGGYDVIQLRSDLARFSAYCKFFGKDSLIVNDRVYSYNPENATFDDYSGIYWTADGDENHPASISLDFVDKTKVELTDNEDETSVLGTYTFSKGVITVTIAGKKAELEFLGDSLICWKGSEIFANTLGTGMLTFDLPYYMSYNGLGNSGTWGSDVHGNTLTFKGVEVTVKSDGSSAVPSGTYNYRIRGNKLVFTGGNKSYTVKINYYELIDEAGNIYRDVPDKENSANGNNQFIIF